MSRYLPAMSAAAVTAAVADPVLRPRPGRVWWACLVVSLGLTLVMAVSIVWLLWQGVGIWGLNSANVWGFALANYVWWIGIGNAGTLISALLLLTRQHWRASVSRFAEAMTLIAAAIAGLFPILHLGRPWLFWWLVPYPDTMGLYPQWQSPLVWDFFAIAGYLLFSAMFWYAGALPDFATLRDRAATRGRQVAFGILAMGWRNSARHWAAYQSYYTAMAALGVPLVVSVHSVVGLDFAAGLMPGWQETIFPPYFVVGAMYSGFAMVVVLAAVVRRALDLQALILPAHFDVLGKVLLFGALVMALSYGSEWIVAWYAQEPADLFLVRWEFLGVYGPVYLAMLACNCAVPQLLWLPAVRRTPGLIVPVAILVNLGMWLERVLIVAVTPARGHLPSQWSVFWPTLWDWLLLAGSLGFFALLFLLFLRLLPAASMHEIKARLHQEAAP